jgi:beta-glucosidase
MRPCIIGLAAGVADRVGGWQSSETSRAFADYAGYVAERLTDRVKNIFTVNEAGRFVTSARLGHRRARAQIAAGRTEPGAPPRRTRPRFLPCGQSAPGRQHQVGPAETSRRACLRSTRRKTSAPPRSRRARTPASRRDPEGKYTDHFLQYAGDAAPKFTAEELKIISSPNDFVGLNIYAPQFYVVASDRAPGFRVLPFPASFPHMNSEWLRIGPETIYWVPRLAAKIWNLDTIYISENGTSSEDKLAADGQVYDLDRIMYLRNYLTQLQRATAEGVPERGYFLWSLMDNFEWIFGFEKRFGLYRVDFETQARVPKLSAAFYRDVVARNAIGV